MLIRDNYNTMTYLSDLVLLLILLEHPLVHGRFLAVPTVNLVPNYRANCPEIEEILRQIRRNISDCLSELFSTSVPECGNGLWYRVAYLNMTDPSQQCSPAWREYNTSGVRACGRPVSSSESCPATLYSINRQYSRVCGRVIGYQVESPDGFFQFHAVHGLNRAFMDGISITYGDPRHHIWSYVAGAYENRIGHTISNCPCSSAPGFGPRTSIVGSNFYCESGNPTDSFPAVRIFTSDRLWDGEQCEGTCCSGTKSPPWFSVQLPTQTSDRIEVRICADESTSNEDVLIELLEIFVQ